MNKLPIRLPRRSMRTKLALYMLVPVVLILIMLAVCLSLFGRFKTPKDTLSERLDTQAMSFEKELLSHRNSLVTVGTHLSEDSAALIEGYLLKAGITLDALSDGVHLAALQERIIEPLRQYLLQADCSGAFVLFNATVGINSDEPSYSGLYLQVNGYESDRREMILYRGISSVGKAHGIMPHRKWRLETRKNVIPGWDESKTDPSLPLALTYRFTDIFTLPGMSEKATLIMLPIRDGKGKTLGVCGFEISESCFARLHSQTTKLPHFTGIITHGDSNSISSFLSCGSDDGYYYAPSGTLSVSDSDGKIITLTDDNNTYLGMKRSYTDAGTGGGFTIIVMTNKSSYDREATDAVVKNMLLIGLIIALSVAFCIFFSRSYLSPVLKALEQLKKDERLSHRGAPAEIGDLFAFLAEKDKSRQSVIDGLKREMADAGSELSKLQAEQSKLQEEYERARTQISRLTTSAMQEVSPEGYAHFTSNLCKLTPKEREIFDFYLAGKNGKEIQETLSISENTLKYHNKHIYQTLNITSRKELLRYAAMMQESDAAKPD
ncbi:MAG: LuxR C-terminal-related transcriptional regulator [Eubacterium sp.]|nr:LuxR C-terminal-related transcriptional regulator [Eubacterium sp.]